MLVIMWPVSTTTTGGLDLFCTKFQIPTSVWHCSSWLFKELWYLKKIEKSTSIEGCKMKLSMLLVEEWNFMSTEFQIPTSVWHCSSWLFKVVKY